MALVDPYAPCPCGSGQKFKWCCIKVEPYAERAKRLLDSGQLEGALAAIDEGLAKVAENPWLMMQKAIVQIELGQVDGAKATLSRLVEKQPEHRGSSTLLTRLVLETEPPANGTALFQRILKNSPAKERSGLALLANYVGFYLNKAGFPGTAIKHLDLAKELAASDPDPNRERELAQSGLVKVLESSQAISPWEKTPYRLLPAPAGVPAAVQEKFDRALDRAKAGLWSDAAELFLELSTGGQVGPIADRNLGLCRFWLADVPGAVEALRRYVMKAPHSVDAVDIEALCQEIAEPTAGQLVEFIQLSWPLRNREGLIEALKKDPKVDYSGSQPANPEDMSSPVIDYYLMLDRPKTEEAREGLTPDDIPRVQGTVLIGADTVQLEAHDNGQLDALTDRFTTIAGRNIPPAHPRTKVLDKTDKSELALSWNWSLPAELSAEESERLNREEGARVIRDIWPDTPMSYLHRRTPRQVAGHPNAEVPLRAAILHYQFSSRKMASLVDWASIRDELKIPAEPEIDPATVKIEEVHLARLEQIPCDRLDDARLAALYQRANRYGLIDAIYRSGLAIADRPGFCSKHNIPEARLFGELAVHAARDNERAQAMEWLRRGRAEEPSSIRLPMTPIWELHELQIKMMFDQPEDWVPDLAVILERYADNPSASQIINARLVNLGLIRLVSDPERPGETLVDPRPLQYLLQQFGPRITTSSGYLGVSATKGEIWTPGSATGGSSSLWTPGSEAGGPSSADRPRLILPGQ